ncbi:MAG: 30S ribosomal protein S20 [Halobacteriovoraceae bacterium]|nr:30S ribosomal protein S20 [Halobacteriovoraceae bacterium]
MANHKSAKKRSKQTISKTARNRSRLSEARSAIKKLRTAISENDKSKATGLLTEAQSLLSKMVSAGILKANNAARKTSRLTSQVNKI